MRSLLAVSLLFALSACDDDQQSGVFNVGMVFPDAVPNVSPTTVPLDPVHNFPLRVQVCAHVANVEGTLSAHVWVAASGQPSLMITGTPVFDTTVALAPFAADMSVSDATTVDGCGLLDDMGRANYYVGAALLNAPELDANTVTVDVGGRSVSQTVIIGSSAALVALSAPKLVEIDNFDGGAPGDAGLVGVGMLGSGKVYEACTTATDARGNAISGLSVAFSGVGAMLSPSTVVTSQTGQACAITVLTPGTQALVTVSGGGAFNAFVGPSLPPGTPTTLKSLTARLPPPDAGVQPAVGTIVYEVVAVVDGAATVNFSVLAQGGGTPPTIFPASTSASASAPAVAYIAVPAGQTDVVAAQVGAQLLFTTVPP